MLKIYIFAPKNPKIIEEIINVASKAGAGVIGKYTSCAFVTTGIGCWKPEVGANPTDGVVGNLSKEPQVKIEMVCPEESAGAVEKAVRGAHPYEEPEINFVRLENIDA